MEGSGTEWKVAWGNALFLHWVRTGTLTSTQQGSTLQIKRVEREETWEEFEAARGLFLGPWVLCGDFNTSRHPSEKKRCLRINRAMTRLLGVHR